MASRIIDLPDIDIKPEEVKRGVYARKLPLEFVHEVRALGFPYLEWDEEKYMGLFEKLKKLTVDDIVINKTIKMDTRFSKLASIFFPEMYEVKVPNKKSPVKSFSGDWQLALAIEFATRSGVKPLTRAGLRSILSYIDGTQLVANFRPDVAKAVYDYTNAKNVYDFSMGWGGRMLGFLVSGAETYLGVDVNKLLFPRYERLLARYDPDSTKKVTRVLSPAENFREESLKGYFDLAFSSPPYFSKEKYSQDEEQSYKTYKTLKEWEAGFLRPTIENASYMLREDGNFVINIANIRIGYTRYPLVDLTKEICKDLGFVQYDEWHYITKRVPGEGEFPKEEPIMFFRRSV